MKGILKFIKNYWPTTLWVIVFIITLIMLIIFDPIGELEGRNLFEQIGHEIGKIGKAIADGFTGK